MDNKELELKVQALLQRIGQMGAESAGEIADLRVKLTLATQQVEQLQQSLTELKSSEREEDIE